MQSVNVLCEYSAIREEDIALRQFCRSRGVSVFNGTFGILGCICKRSVSLIQRREFFFKLGALSVSYQVLKQSYSKISGFVLKRAS